MHTKRLWEHQIQSVNLCKKYIEDYSLNKTEGAALVQLPTGTGKSGVITIVSRNIEGLVLVLTPRIALRDQLYNDIKGRFFSNLGIEECYFNGNIYNVQDSKLLTEVNYCENNILVMTIQMLVSAQKKYMNILRKNTKLIMFDEGHYEPSNEWSLSIRTIEAPKIIVTATPYRNDFRMFNIDNNYINMLTYHEAIRKNYIRDLEIIELESYNKNEPISFVNNVVKKYKDLIEERKIESDSRVIIKCNSFNEINDLCSCFDFLKRDYIAIHENFSTCVSKGKYKNVPNPNEAVAKIWIHQYKLVEGIDDKRFRLLAIYSPIKNTRMLIQQVGRILRNPQQEINQKAYLLQFESINNETELWNEYLNYDLRLDKLDYDKIKSGIFNETLLDIMDRDASTIYLDGRFRSKLEYDKINPLDDIELPRKANIFFVDKDFNIDNLAESTIENIRNKEGTAELIKCDNEEVKVIITTSFNNSQYLRKHIFIDTKLEIIVMMQIEKFLYVYSKKSISYSDNVEIKPIRVELLKNLFGKGEGAKLTRVNLSNSNLGKSSVRLKSLSANSIKDTIPNLDDNSQICTIAEGISRDYVDDDQQLSLVRRYVGFTNATVSQNGSQRVVLSEYIKWLEYIHSIINAKNESLNELNRYASIVDKPEDTTPINILLDIEDLNEVYVTRENKEPIEIANICCDIDDGKFTITANGTDYECKIAYKKDKYTISCKELKISYECIKEGYEEDIIKHFNRLQTFKILPKDFSKIYVSGQFYNPAIKIGDAFDEKNYELKYCFYPDAIIGNMSSEKGFHSYYQDDIKDTWDPNSLFGSIATLGNGCKSVKDLFGKPDFLICDDCGTEIADFILGDTEIKRIALIHAKASTDQGIVATRNLHEVCSQALKNLGYLSNYNNETPSKINSWKSEWKGKVNGGDGNVSNRLVLGDNVLEPLDIWKKLRSIVNNHNAIKEVWLVLGNFFSQSEFEKKLKKKKVEPHVLQAYYLLHSTMTQVGAVGAKLKIICKP